MCVKFISAMDGRTHRRRDTASSTRLLMLIQVYFIRRLEMSPAARCKHSAPLYHIYPLQGYKNVYKYFGKTLVNTLKQSIYIFRWLPRLPSVSVLQYVVP